MKASVHHHPGAAIDKLHMLLRVAGIALILVILASIAEGAEPKADPAAQFVQQLGNEALAARKLPDGERGRRVLELVRSDIDVNAIGRFMLGAYWRGTTEAQRAEYVSLIEQQLVRTYDRRFGGQSFRVGKVIHADSDTLVGTEIGQTNGRPPVAVEWRVRDDHGQMKIVDIIVEGMSMSVERRGDFASIIERNGGNIDALLSTLKSN